jgi:hypothetical protein
MPQDLFDCSFEELCVPLSVSFAHLMSSTIRKWAHVFQDNCCKWFKIFVSNLYDGSRGWPGCYPWNCLHWRYHCHCCCHNWLLSPLPPHDLWSTSWSLLSFSSISRVLLLAFVVNDSHTRATLGGHGCLIANMIGTATFLSYSCSYSLLSMFPSQHMCLKITCYLPRTDRGMSGSQTRQHH